MRLVDHCTRFWRRFTEAARLSEFLFEGTMYINSFACLLTCNVFFFLQKSSLSSQRHPLSSHADVRVQESPVVENGSYYEVTCGSRRQRSSPGLLSLMQYTSVE